MISPLGLIWGLAITGITSGLAFGLLIWKFDPTATGSLGIILFFVSLGVFLIASIFFLLHGLLRRSWKEVPPLLASLRQAVILAIGIIATLVLAYFNLVAWWNLVLLAILALATEVYFRVRLE